MLVVEVWLVVTLAAFGGLISLVRWLVVYLPAIPEQPVAAFVVVAALVTVWEWATVPPSGEELAAAAA